uniref:Single domain-containing protein n=1 Tax=Amblyomma triste TaxID=251400 RepID=A0A023G6K3_AMBTT
MRFCTIAAIIATYLASVAFSSENKPMNVVFENGYCKFASTRIKDKVASYQQDPCAMYECRANTSQLLITGCPPPQDIPRLPGSKYWPACCPTTK